MEKRPYRRSLWQAMAMGVLLLTLAATCAPRTASGAQGAGSWPRIAVVERAAGLRDPVHIAHAGDGSGRLFIVERAGTVRLLQGGRLLPAPLLDITALVSSSGSERGLLSIAFPPSYAAAGRFYLYYTDLAGNLVIARYRVGADPNAADPASAQIVLTIPHPTYANHNGGQLAFGPADGFLYIGTGDGGGAGDPGENAQDPAVLLGKLLRIDVETGEPLTYTVPATNPFTQTAGTLPEIWALGLRNPWRFSFDRQTGDLYIGDVGQGGWEEVDYQPAGSAGGENYGWDVLEGAHCYEPAAGCTPPPAYVPPVAEYAHDLGCSITGGAVYRGGRAPGLLGTYLYADFCSGRLWGLRAEAGGWSGALLLEVGFAVSTWGEDEAGNLFLADYGAGRILEVVQRFQVHLPLLVQGGPLADLDRRTAWRCCSQPRP